jgi:hypothetical protein
MDGVEYGPDWRNSPLFTDETFGAFNNDHENGFGITGGRFAFLPVARDLEHTYDRYEPGIDDWVGQALLRTRRRSPLR